MQQPAALLILLIGIAYAVEFKDVEEKCTCGMIPTDPNLSPETMKWVRSAKVVYNPMGSGVDAYKTAEDLIGPEELSKVSREFVGSKTCLYVSMNGTELPIYGFGNQEKMYEGFPDPIRPGILHWAIRDGLGNKKFRTTAIITKTDNKSYFFAVTLWADGSKGFHVKSRVPLLTPEIRKEVMAHAMEMGFNPKNIIDFSYENCPPPPKALLEN